jgi:hypothetical protein
MLVEVLSDTVDAVYEAVCRDNDEKATLSGRVAFEESVLKESNCFGLDISMFLMVCMWLILRLL